MSKPTKGIYERLFEKVNLHGPAFEGFGCCWIFRHRQNHAQFWFRGKFYRPHIAAYLMMCGPIPEGKKLQHLCLETFCIRPSHLILVNKGERRMIKSKKYHCKFGHPLSGTNLRIEVRRSGKLSRICRECERDRKIAYQSKSELTVKRLMH